MTWLLKVITFAPPHASSVYTPKPHRVHVLLYLLVIREHGLNAWKKKIQHTTAVITWHYCGCVGDITCMCLTVCIQCHKKYPERERERETDEDRCGEKQISSRFRVPLCLRIFPLILPCGPGWRGEETTGQASFGSARGTGKYGAALSCSAPLSSTCAEWAKRGGLPPEVSVKGGTVERSLWAVLLYKQCLSE